jgi:hypothetical protein
MRKYLLIGLLAVLLSFCEGGNNNANRNYYQEAYDMGKKQGFTCNDKGLRETARESANGWWTGYFHYDVPSTPEEKENYQTFENGWKDGFDEGVRLNTN